MTISNLGEFELIKRFMQRFESPTLSGIEGFGDDCAILPCSQNQSLLVTTDMLVENTHFILKTISPFDLGYKSLAVNLSDIAAMGGKPLYLFLSIGLPPQTPIQWIDQFFAGFHALAHTHSALLLGGDTTRADQVTINVTVMGSMETEKIKRRSAAQIDDIICCTGFLGDSGAGLKLVFEGQDVDHPLIQTHFCPRPHLEEGMWLAQQLGVHAMMDISDGLIGDLEHILEASQCGADIYLDQLPLSNHLKEIATKKQWNAEEIALTAGEDYCLLLTVDATHYPILSQAYQEQFHRPLFAIGQIKENAQELVFYKDHEIKHFDKRGFDHFKT